ncbi:MULTISPECIES: hypothetical protein [Bacteroides]|uniref:hypothetical protein n=1 Tax=Bacteroides TaxID=816 RepID=UPI0025C5DD58|nr:hypothetical protein [Bacteroides sp.]
MSSPSSSLSEYTRTVPSPYQVRTKSVSMGMEILWRFYGGDTEEIRRAYGEGTKKLRLTLAAA